MNRADLQPLKMTMLTNKSNDFLEAFTAAAGISPLELSLLIRTALLACFFIWSAWCVLEIMKYYKSHPSESIGNLLMDYTKIFFLVTVVISLVFI